MTNLTLVIYPGDGDYESLLVQINLLSLEERRNNLCASLIEDMLERLSHNDIRETRANGYKIYDFFCTNERFKNSPLAHAINEYNFKLDK